MQENYPGVETDEFVVMPNHIHGIIVLVGAPALIMDNYRIMGNHEIMGNHRGLPLRCHYRMLFIDSKP